ncbi:cob(I)yrinic acid a,c-diamide adenosyltransferase [Desulfuromonas carbonis]|uniref:cob(I)yrinic acid a,c-diamide adenosyltransferase n=1 Tax=Desulfuromonas sp. DDH964 TaxID=1823759 RepID=UPI00078E76F3|nr:cob(I)yrinic acid a,c-diamide adenosyltransferase [Desulfuromonas sp. DDH964]AMV73950.1 Cob(I)yrinic acid a,c-diamide adenosyltransferase [Desulfuromonas sp. DDH964]
MVRLDRITTGGGDRGETSLADGSRVPKHAPRVAAYGTVDEVNCLLGLVRLEVLPAGLAAEVQRLQQELFDLGADLATPLGDPEKEEHLPRIGAGHVQRLEGLIAAATERLEPLTSFILPGGSRAAATLHLVRTVARRAERTVIEARVSEESAGRQTFNPHALTYLNRLSDLCFVWARLCNDGGREDILWTPYRGDHDPVPG